MTHETIHPLPFFELSLKSAYQDDLGCHALCVFARVPSLNVRVLAIKSSLHPDVQMGGFVTQLEKILGRIADLHFEHSSGGLNELIRYMREHLDEISHTCDSFVALRKAWCDAMDRWRAVTDKDGAIIAAHKDEANALLALTVKVPTPPGPLRVSDASGQEKRARRGEIDKIASFIGVQLGPISDEAGALNLIRRTLEYHDLKIHAPKS